MNRILALQGLSAFAIGDTGLLAASNQSNNCSSATTACSTQSFSCGKQTDLAW